MNVRRHFFVLAQGRSGTAFLADLLNRSPRALVLHEPGPSDRQLLGLSRFGCAQRAVEALLEERFADLLPSDPEVAVYGEVNSYLRYCAPWLRSRLDAHLLHVSRDGREVVRSAYGRDVQMPRHAQLSIVPADDDPWAETWPSFSRFERICWIWQHTNEMLWKSVGNHARLEDLVSSYEHFRSALLEPTGLTISEPTWRANAGRRLNTGGRYRFRRRLRDMIRAEAPPETGTLPHWSEWPDERHEQFWRICGATMERLGYGSIASGHDSATPG